MRVLVWMTVAMLMIPSALAGEPEVVDAEVTKGTDGRFNFRVTVLHEDEGWDHYADRWEVVSPSGEVLATRVLLHPHETEQPFTRGLAGVRIPPGTTTVILRAHDKVHGLGAKTRTIELPK